MWTHTLWSKDFLFRFLAGRRRKVSFYRIGTQICVHDWILPRVRTDSAKHMCNGFFWMRRDYISLSLASQEKTNYSFNISSPVYWHKEQNWLRKHEELVAFVLSQSHQGMIKRCFLSPFFNSWNPTSDRRTAHLLYITHRLSISCSHAFRAGWCVLPWGCWGSINSPLQSKAIRGQQLSIGIWHSG